RRRRRRRGAFWLLFLVLVLVGVGSAAVLFGWSPGGSSNPSATDLTTTTTTSGLPHIPPARLYKTTDGVNVRAGPATTYPTIGTIETGVPVLVVCAIDGENVNGPGGPTNQWVRIVFNGKAGYITAAYVSIGPEINDPRQIGRCPPV
ncbi:MAG TPA: SH3 domain-containing protein, partial [Acidimicrobiia bacterium]|nr:SH3 domain-containing protein [Acidimicrobiia bacterium]